MDERRATGPTSSTRRACTGTPCARLRAGPSRVYLPPGYDAEPERRYPLIVFLHGYGMNARRLTIGSREHLRRDYPLLARLVLRKQFGWVLLYEELDRLIGRGALPPFILAQPDGSLPIPHASGVRAMDGSVVSKGSFYTDSPFTGNFLASVSRDAVWHLDGGYRTIPEARARAMMGCSMGGYGALLCGIRCPELFASIVALSPAVSCLDLLDVKLLVPLNRLFMGEKKARERGRQDVEDILDTSDLVFSRDRPLLPTLRRDASGRVVEMDEAARRAWETSDLCLLARASPAAFRGTRVLVNCEESDEFGFAGPCRRFHGTLESLGIAHELEIYRDPEAARYSAHTLGIARHILPGIRFCLEHMRV